jgi:diketogulonate reductase-like aldo/keto reductase
MMHKAKVNWTLPVGILSTLVKLVPRKVWRNTMLNWRLKNGYFPIPLWLHRKDIEKLLECDVSHLTDGDMEYLAKRIADDFLGQRYTEALRETVEYFMQSRRPTENRTEEQS